MFDIGWGELLLIGIVALIAIGPKELPGALRALGQWVAKIRRMASEFQNQFHEAMREAELADLKKEVDEMATKAQSYAQFDPIEDIRKDIESAASPPPVLDQPPSSPAADGPAPAPASGELPTPAAPAANEASTDPAGARRVESASLPSTEAEPVDTTGSPAK